jgi:hypothetical protein
MDTNRRPVGQISYICSNFPLGMADFRPPEMAKTRADSQSKKEVSS